MLNRKIKIFKVTDFINKKFYSNIWIFDVSIKSNNLLTKIEQMPMSFKFNVTLPLLPFNSDGISRLKMIFNSLKLLTIFSKSKSYLSTFWIIQKNKKWLQGGIVSSFNYKINNISTLPLFSLVAFPYIWISEGNSKFMLLSDGSGNLNFTISEISFLIKFLNENFIGWNKTICFNFILNNPTIKNNLSSYKFITSMVNWLIWSSLNFKCVRGHGAFTTTSKVNKLFINNLNKFSTKKYII